MRLLAIDTTGTGFSLALFKGDKVVSAEHWPNGDQASDLVPELNDFLHQADVSMGTLGKIAVCKGPGSFTGIRLGISTAYGLGLALGKPVVGISALQAWAWQAHHHNPKQLPIHVLIDAGSSYFSQVFDHELNPRSKPQHITTETVMMRILNEPFLAVGSGWKNKPQFQELAADHITSHFLFATTIGHLALKAEMPANMNIEPLYLKPTYVQHSANNSG